MRDLASAFEGLQRGGTVSKRDLYDSTRARCGIDIGGDARLAETHRLLGAAPEVRLPVPAIEYDV